MSNPFAQFAEDTKPAWKQRKERTVATRRERAIAKKDDEQAEINRAAAAWRWARLEELKAGPYGAQIKALRSFMRTMTLDDGDRLVELASGPWMKGADADTRYDVFALVSRGIRLMRERNGLTPFDDPLTDRNVFLEIRLALYGV